MTLTINTDGGSRGNPGPAAAAYIVKNNAGDVLEKCGNYLGIQTNNVAEYTAIRDAWNWLEKSGERFLEQTEILFLLDSELVVRQIKGIYRVKDQNLIVLWKEILEKQRFFLEKFENFKCSYTHVPREQNLEADALVNKTLDAHRL